MAGDGSASVCVCRLNRQQRRHCQPGPFAASRSETKAKNVCHRKSTHVPAHKHTARTHTTCDIICTLVVIYFIFFFFVKAKVWLVCSSVISTSSIYFFQFIFFFYLGKFEFRCHGGVDSNRMFTNFIGLGEVTKATRFTIVSDFTKYLFCMKHWYRYRKTCALSRWLARISI